VVGSREAVAGEETTRRARHSTRSQHRMDDHAVHGNPVAANAQVGGERSLGGEFSARPSEDRGVNYLGFLAPEDPRFGVFRRHARARLDFGFSVKGGEAEAFRLLDALQVIKLAVSLAARRL